jgi:CRP-like cAMP-binding protein/Fe-S-cluster-containing hydrogenase component 2/thioredoxin reductase
MSEQFEVAIIGAGPAGLGAAANASHHKISHVLIEKREIGNTIFDYQLGKHVMAEPTRLPLVTPVPFAAGTRELVLQGWNDAVKDHRVNLKKGEVTAIKRTAAGFEIVLGAEVIAAKHVVLSIGVQGSPRKLGVPGEDLPHVAYTLADPGAFTGRNILVVGAGDAAIENALALADKNTVSILNRTDEFPRAKEANAAKIMEAIKAGRVRAFMNSSVARIEAQTTYIATPDGEVALTCDHIIARLGCILPRKFLEGCGIAFPNEDPAAVPVVSRRYESNVPNLFILGALIGYPLIKQAMNQGHEVIEHIIGNAIEPADQVLIREKLDVLPGDTNANLEMIRTKLPLFKELSDSQFRELIIDSTIHIKKPGDVVFERNDYTDTFWSIVEGSVAVELPDGKGGVDIFAGNYFGEVGLLSGRRRSATVKVSEAAILVESPRKQILKLNASLDSVKRSLDEAFMRRALQTSIFPDASEEFLARLVQKAAMKKFKKGEVIFREGDPGDLCYVIRKGSVKIARRNARGVDVAQTYLAAGNLVGEMALLSADGKGRSATVTAAVPCELIAISKEDFVALLEQNPKVKKKVSQLVRERHVENITQVKGEYTGQLLDFMMGEGVTDADNFLLIDSDLCVGCDNCEAACAATHNGHSRLDRKGGKNYANIQVPISCRHCENPLCMLDCPPDALARKPNGEVIIRDSCIGCGNCTRNCPYGVIQLVYDSPEWSFSLFEMLGLKKKKKEKGPAKAAKCDLCEKLPGGPACVRSCPTGAAIRVNPRQMLQILSDKRASGGG